MQQLGLQEKQRIDTVARTAPTSAIFAWCNVRSNDVEDFIPVACLHSINHLEHVSRPAQVHTHHYAMCQPPQSIAHSVAMYLPYVDKHNCCAALPAMVTAVDAVCMFCIVL
jgi:hypothetical protein